jgi:hypothetical protein
MGTTLYTFIQSASVRGILQETVARAKTTVMAVYMYGGFVYNRFKTVLSCGAVDARVPLNWLMDPVMSEMTPKV